MKPTIPGASHRGILRQAQHRFRWFYFGKLNAPHFDLKIKNRNSSGFRIKPPDRLGSGEFFSYPMIKHVDDELSLEKFVDDAETAISREHTLWLARTDSTELFR